ncbi:MAG TPA: YbhB/YbcL family Raf kinase inhibitor-like protein [Acetobacteraceae bacterium]|nr:YbhB/YbcL family Raf kinase inhibitor-like protein [Acetobacteraceae bacterium]
MRLTSFAFVSGSHVPVRFTCDGEDVSPPLAWTEPPASVQSFALICSDPDAPAGTWYHWTIYDIPPAMRSLDEHWQAADPRARQTINDFGRKGYGGPCPPRGARAHRYVFRLYALNVARLNVGAQPRCPEVEAAAKTHAVAVAELLGLYARGRH